MRGPTVLRRVHGIALLMLLPASLALAQPPPPPPPPPLTPLPAPPVPAGNPLTAAKANLGKALFWDEQLSSTRTVACGSCHQSKRGGSDPRSTVGAMRATHPGPDGVTGTADDVTGSPGVVLSDASGAYQWSSLFGLGAQVTPRKSPSHINAAYSPLQFWDGRAGGTFADPISGATVLLAGGSLENQVLGPPVSSVEMGHVGRDWNDVAARVAASKPLALSAAIPAALSAWIAGRGYAALFAEAFGSADVTPSRIALAIASYERTLFSTQTPFDSLIAGTATLTPQETAGFNLFGAVGCAGCHAGSLTSDNNFHYLGVRPAAEDSGRMVVTHNLADLGAMKTPSLRNVALRPAFFHDGRFATLAEVVAFYDRGGDFNAPNKSPAVRPLGLTPQQQAALVAFLGRPLTDPRVANQLAPFDRPLLYSETELVPQVLAGGIAGSGGGVPQVVAVEPPLVGNPDFSVGLAGALGGAPAVLVIDDHEPATGAGIPSSGSFAWLSTTLAGAGAGGGYGSVSLAIPDDPSLAGQVFYGRWYVTDPAAPGGVAASASFRFEVFGPHAEGVAGMPGGGTIAAPAAVRLYPSQPNPFRPSTVLRFDLFKASDVRLTVFDVQGRAVRRLVAGRYSQPGTFSVTWDGTDDAGRAAPGGVYFYRLEADGAAETRRMVRLQ